MESSDMPKTSQYQQVDSDSNFGASPVDHGVVAEEVSAREVSVDQPTPKGSSEYEGLHAPAMNEYERTLLTNGGNTESTFDSTSTLKVDDSDKTGLSTSDSSQPTAPTDATPNPYEKVLSGDDDRSGIGHTDMQSPNTVPNAVPQVESTSIGNAAPSQTATEKSDEAPTRSEADSWMSAFDEPSAPPVSAASVSAEPASASTDAKVDFASRWQNGLADTVRSGVEEALNDDSVIPARAASESSDAENSESPKASTDAISKMQSLLNSNAESLLQVANRPKLVSVKLYRGHL